MLGGRMADTKSDSQYQQVATGPVPGVLVVFNDEIHAARSGIELPNERNSQVGGGAPAISPSKNGRVNAANGRH